MCSLAEIWQYMNTQPCVCEPCNSSHVARSEDSRSRACLGYECRTGALH